MIWTIIIISAIIVAFTIDYAISDIKDNCQPHEWDLLRPYTFICRKCKKKVKG